MMHYNNAQKVREIPININNKKSHSGTKSSSSIYTKKDQKEKEKTTEYKFTCIHKYTHRIFPCLLSHEEKQMRKYFPKDMNPNE